MEGESSTTPKDEEADNTTKENQSGKQHHPEGDDIANVKDNAHSPKKRATTRLTPTAEETTPQEPTTPEARGSDFLTSLANPKEEEEGNTTNNEERGWQAPKAGGGPAAPPKRREGVEAPPLQRRRMRRATPPKRDEKTAPPKSRNATPKKEWNVGPLKAAPPTKGNGRTQHHQEEEVEDNTTPENEGKQHYPEGERENNTIHKNEWKQHPLQGKMEEEKATPPTRKREITTPASDTTQKGEDGKTAAHHKEKSRN